MAQGWRTVSPSSFAHVCKLTFFYASDGTAFLSVSEGSWHPWGVKRRPHLTQLSLPTLCYQFTTSSELVFFSPWHMMQLGMKAHNRHAVVTFSYKGRNPFCSEHHVELSALCVVPRHLCKEEFTSTLCTWKSLLLWTCHQFHLAEIEVSDCAKQPSHRMLMHDNYEQYPRHCIS